MTVGGGGWGEPTASDSTATNRYAYNPDHTPSAPPMDLDSLRTPPAGVYGGPSAPTYSNSTAPSYSASVGFNDFNGVGSNPNNAVAVAGQAPYGVPFTTPSKPAAGFDPSADTPLGVPLVHQSNSQELSETESQRKERLGLEGMAGTCGSIVAIVIVAILGLAALSIGIAIPKNKSRAEQQWFGLVLVLPGLIMTLAAIVATIGVFCSSIEVTPWGPWVSCRQGRARGFLAISQGSSRGFIAISQGHAEGVVAIAQGFSFGVFCYGQLFSVGMTVFAQGIAISIASAMSQGVAVGIYAQAMGLALVVKGNLSSCMTICIERNRALGAIPIVVWVLTALAIAWWRRSPPSLTKKFDNKALDQATGRAGSVLRGCHILIALLLIAVVAGIAIVSSAKPDDSFDHFVFGSRVDKDASIDT